MVDNDTDRRSRERSRSCGGGPFFLTWLRDAETSNDTH